MNNINENRTDKEHPAAKKQGGVKMVYFVPCRHLFSADYHPRGGGMVYKRRCLAIGITGFMQAVIVYGGLGLVAVIIALVLFILLIQPDATFLQKVGRTAGILLCLAVAFSFVRPLVLDIPYLSARKPPIWSGWNLNIREGSGTMVRRLLSARRRYDRRTAFL